MERLVHNLKKHLGTLTLEKIIVVIIIGIALLLRFWNLEGLPRFSYDEGNYCDISENTANGRFMWWSHSFAGPTYWNLPLFFIFTAISFTLFGSGIVQARAVSAIFGSLTCYLAYRFGKDILNKEKVGILAAGLYAIDAYALSIDRLALLDTTQSFFIALSIFFCYISFRRNKQAYTILAGISAGLAILTKATGAFAILIIFVSTLLNAIKGKRELEQSIRSFIILLVVCILTISPYLIFARLSDPDVIQTMIGMYLLRPQRGEAQGIYYFALSIRSNPLTFGFGFIGLVYSIFLKKRKESFLLFPWIVAPTIVLLFANKLPLRYLSPLFLPLSIAASVFIIDIAMQFGSSNRHVKRRLLCELFANPRILLSVLIGLIVLIGLYNTLNSVGAIFTSEGDYEPQQVANYLDMYVEEGAVIVGNPAIDFLSKKHVFHDTQTLIENAERQEYTLHQPLLRKLDYLIVDPQLKYGWGISPELQEFLESQCILERTFGDTDLYRVF